MGLIHFLQGIFTHQGSVPKDESSAEAERHRELWDGYVLRYREESNGYGGYHHVDEALSNSESELHVVITNEDGRFVDFPGAVPGSWESDLTSEFVPQVRFRSSIERSRNADYMGVYCWTVQPDGMYWADEDGYGVRPDVEVKLFAPIGWDGRFAGQFSTVNPNSREDEIWTRGRSAAKF